MQSERSRSSCRRSWGNRDWFHYLEGWFTSASASSELKKLEQKWSSLLVAKHLQGSKTSPVAPSGTFYTNMTWKTLTTLTDVFTVVVHTAELLQHELVVTWAQSLSWARVGLVSARFGSFQFSEVKELDDKRGKTWDGRERGIQTVWAREGCEYLSLSSWREGRRWRRRRDEARVDRNETDGGDDRGQRSAESRQTRPCLGSTCSGSLVPFWDFGFGGSEVVTTPRLSEPCASRHQTPD